MAGHPKKIYTIAELGRIRSKFCGCERKELLFYYESEKREVCSRVWFIYLDLSGTNPKTLQYLIRYSDIAVTFNVYTYIGLGDAAEERKLEEVENACRK